MRTGIKWHRWFGTGPEKSFTNHTKYLWYEMHADVSQKGGNNPEKIIYRYHNKWWCIRWNDKEPIGSVDSFELAKLMWEMMK